MDLDLDLVLVERSADTSRTMGSKAIKAAQSAGPWVWFRSTDFSSKTRTKTRTLGGCPEDQSGEVCWVAGKARPVSAVVSPCHESGAGATLVTAWLCARWRAGGKAEHFHHGALRRQITKVVNQDNPDLEAAMKKAGLMR